MARAFGHVVALALIVSVSGASIAAPSMPAVKRATPDVTAQTYTEAKFGMYGWIANQMETCPFKEDFNLGDIVGELVRFVGHDFMSDFKVDGCFGLTHPENKGLDYALSVFLKHKDEFCPPQMSQADCIVVLAEASMDFLVMGARPGVQGTSSILETPFPLPATSCVVPADAPKTAVDDTPCVFYNGMGVPGVMNFETSFGRQLTPIGECEPNSPNGMRSANPAPLRNEGGGPPPGIGKSINFTEIHRVLGGGQPTEGGKSSPCGFSDANVIALMGVHTIGRAHKENSGMDGFWVDPRKHANGVVCADGKIGCGPSLFDHQYYKDFFSMGWKKAENGQWVCVPGSFGADLDSMEEEFKPEVGSEIFADKVFTENACFPNSLRLPADMAILFDLTEEDDLCIWKEDPANPGKVQQTCKLNDVWGEAKEYAEDDAKWLKAFRDAWKVMMDCNHANLQSPLSIAELSHTKGLAESFYWGGDLKTTVGDLPAPCDGVCKEYSTHPVIAGFKAAPNGQCL